MRIMSCIASYFLILVLSIVTNIHSSTYVQDQSKEKATKLAEICRKHEVPAMSAAVVNSKGLVQSQCFGVRKRGTSDNVELSDRFPIGSNTKSMTATLAAVLVDAGKIQWETTIGEVWPKATDEDLHSKLRNVTLDQLLSHQGGVPGNISDLSVAAWGKLFEEKLSPTLERKAMLKLALSKAPSQPLGTFVYSNVGYAIASAMLEACTGESYESLTKKHVFDPLEMRSPDFRSLQSAKQSRPPMMWGHQAANGEPVDPRTMGAENPTVYAAAGTVHLSIEDYAKCARGGSWRASHLRYSDRKVRLIISIGLTVVGRLSRPFCVVKRGSNDPLPGARIIRTENSGSILAKQWRNELSCSPVEESPLEQHGRPR